MANWVTLLTMFRWLRTTPLGSPELPLVTEAVIWVAVGGRGTIIGPIVGAVLVNAGKSVFTGAFPSFWLYCLGGLFIFVTLFMPKGIVGLFARVRARRGKEASSAAESGEDPTTLNNSTKSLGKPEPAE